MQQPCVRQPGHLVVSDEHIDRPTHVLSKLRGLEQIERSDAVAGRGSRETGTEFDDLIGESRSQVERSKASVVDDVDGMNGSEREGRQIEELLQRGEERELGEDPKLVRRGRCRQRGACRCTVTLWLGCAPGSAGLDMLGLLGSWIWPRWEGS
jgi:hypothetical protein